MVNRIWHYHFGRGLVATPSDFGDMGFRPTHPELLDWMALEFMVNGWSVKHMHRLILNSKTYRQASLPRKDGLAKDAGSDVALALPSPPPRGGSHPGQRPLAGRSPRSENVWALAFCFSYPTPIMPATGSPRTSSNPKTCVAWSTPCASAWNRIPSSGLSTARTVDRLPPTEADRPRRFRLSIFTTAHSWVTSPNVSPSASPRKWARTQANKSNGLIPGAFGRSPREEETNETLAYLDEHGLPALCRILLNANEFLFLQ